MVGQTHNSETPTVPSHQVAIIAKFDTDDNADNNGL